MIGVYRFEVHYRKMRIKIVTFISDKGEKVTMTRVGKDVINVPYNISSHRPWRWLVTTSKGSWYTDEHPKQSVALRYLK